MSVVVEVGSVCGVGYYQRWRCGEMIDEEEVIGDDLAPEYLMSQKIPSSFESQETFL